MNILKKIQNNAKNLADKIVSTVSESYNEYVEDISTINFCIKLQPKPGFKEEQIQYLNELKKLNSRVVKLTTNALDVVMDRKDDREIICIKKVKIIYELEKGCLIVIGNLGCSFKEPYGGELFVLNIKHDESICFNDIRGVRAKMSYQILNGLTSIETMKSNLITLKEHKDFIYNIKQFEEFMSVFEFYKKISAELNNNISYQINNISDKEYCFIPIDSQETNLEFKEEVLDLDDVLKGYKFEDYYYEQLHNNIKENVLHLVDIEIDATKEDYRRIKSVGIENLYISNFDIITDKLEKEMKQLNLINVTEKNNCLVLSVEIKKYDGKNYKYLNLYDMGQKIKVDSIDNSLRLINQGAAGSASELLEYIIGDRVIPNINMQRENTLEYSKNLNESQRRAFEMCIDGSAVSLIKGPPGTGKTHVINAITQYITKELQEKVIISSQTHIAIDNVLDKLMTNHDIIIPNRITSKNNKYSEENIDSTLFKTWGQKIDKHVLNSSNTKLAKSLLLDLKKFNGVNEIAYSRESDQSDYSVLGATTTTSAIAGKKGLEILKDYDWLIIDEVSKCPITEVLRYLPYVKKIIMVGDDYQLSPLLEFSKETVSSLPSYNEDMFEKLEKVYKQSVFADTLEKARKCGRLVLLNENYRSLPPILNTYNVFYDAQLICKKQESENTILIKQDSILFNKNISFIEVKNGKEVTDGTSRYNIEELRATALILEELIKKIENASEISVAAIFPYAAQISKFKKDYKDLINKAKIAFKTFEIDTVDAFQGKESDIVLCNTVVADSSRGNFLNDFRRINVAMSRAKNMLIVFGNSLVLKRIYMKSPSGSQRKYLKEIIEYIESNDGKIEYQGGELNATKSEASILFK